MLTDLIFFVIGFVLACALFGVLYVRAKRNGESILTVIHTDLGAALNRIEAKLDGGKSA